MCDSSLRGEGKDEAKNIHEKNDINLLNLVKHMNLQIQESQSTPSR